MKDEILKIVTDALKGAGARFDTDGQTVWVDGKDGRTFAVCVNECVGDDDPRNAEKDTYTVHLHASFMGAFDVKAESDSKAEQIVRDRFTGEEIKVSDLEFESVTVDAEIRRATEMGFSMRIVRKDGTDVVLPKKHDIAGGTYAIGGTADAWMSVTFNYARFFFRVFGGEGLRTLHGMEIRKAKPLLEQAIAALGDAEPDADYWKPTEGNARKALVGLHRLSELAIAAFPDDEMRWDCE